MKKSSKMVPAVVTIFLAICSSSYAAVSTKRGVVVPYDNYRCDDLTTLTGISWWLTKGLKLPKAVDGPCSDEPVQEHVPMKWHQYGVATIGDDIPDGTEYLYSFYEPNHKFGANITPMKAALKHKVMEESLKAAGKSHVKILSPSIAIQPCLNVTNVEDPPCSPAGPFGPFDWLTQFYDNCSSTELNCNIYATAAHHYACDQLNGGVNGLVDQLVRYYGHKVWLTSYACPLERTSEETIAYMKHMIDYLDAGTYDDKVERYAWNGTKMSADGEKSNQLFEENSSDLTAAGVFYNTYVSPYK